MIEVQTLILYSSLFISLFFEIFLLITYLEVREELNFEERAGKDIKWFPTVTIIVPCFNEEKTLAATVCSILKLDYPKSKLSLILVNDGSTDNTAKEISKFKHHPQIKIISKENGGKHTALNLALKQVKSDLVGCLDADSFVNREALKQIVPFFEDKTTMAVTPSILVHEPRSVLQYAQKIEYFWGIFLRRLLSSIGALYVTPGAFSIFRTKVFRRLGGYVRGHHTEDLEMALRMQKNRYKIVYSRGAHVYTTVPEGLGALYRQRVRWAYGFLNNALDYRKLFFNKKYGHVGFFILPIAIFSVFIALYFVGVMLWKGLTSVFDALVKFQTVGISGKFSLPSFDWYFINTDVLTILITIAMILTLVILYLAIKMADGRARLTGGVFFYLILYIFLVPLWLTRAVYSTIFKKQISWR